jgi:hypothetical protein
MRLRSGARLPWQPCSLGAFPLAILLHPRPAINPFLSRLLLYINRTNGCLWIRSGTDGVLLHNGPILFIAVIWQFLPFCLPSIISYSHMVFHRICFCFHGNIFLFMYIFLFSFLFFMLSFRAIFRWMVGPLDSPNWYVATKKHILVMCIHVYGLSTTALYGSRCAL